MQSTIFARLQKTLRVEWVWATLVLGGLAVIFLAGPILFFPKGYFASADNLQQYVAFQTDANPPQPHNTVVSDENLEFLPWLDFERKSLFNGEIPLWNPYNAGGRPLLANMQSSFFNPLVWPQLLLGNHYGLIIKTLLELYLVGFFTFLFLRKLNLRPLAAIAGAIGVEFFGFQVVWLKTPLINTFCVFPLMLYLIEKRLQGGTRKSFVLAMSLTVAWEIFAGHPETFYMNVLIATAYLIFRLATVRREWVSVWARVGNFALYALSGIIGTLIAAIQLLPFAEYLLNSAAFSQRGTMSNFSLEAFQSISLLLPNPFGNPAYSSVSDLNFADPNYSEISGGYVGPTVLFLAVLALWVARKRGVTWFAAGCALVCFGVTYGIWPFFQLVTGVMPLSLIYTRLIGYCGFMLVLLMAVGLHEVLTNYNFEALAVQANRLKLPNWLQPLVGGVVFLVAMAGIFTWFSGSGAVPFERGSVRNFEWTEFLYICGLFVVGLALLTLALRWPKRTWLFGGLLALVIFAQLATFGRLYRSSTEAALFYPQTPTLQALKSNNGMLATGGRADLFPAEINMWYGIPQVNGYDALEVRWFDKLKQAVEAYWPAWDNPIPLNLFNIKQVIASAQDPDFQGIDATHTNQLRRQSKQRGLNIYTNTNYQPEYRVLYSITVRSEANLLEDLKVGKIDVTKQIGFIQGSEPHVLPSGGFESVALPPSPEVKIVSKSNNKAVLQLKNDQPGYLYIDQTYFPGWTAKINGQDAELYRANYAFTALPIPTGQLTIELEYAPWTFTVGAIISGSTLLLLAIVYGVIWLFKRFGWKIGRPRRKHVIKPAKKVNTKGEIKPALESD